MEHDLRSISFSKAQLSLWLTRFKQLPTSLTALFRLRHGNTFMLEDKGDSVIRSAMSAKRENLGLFLTGTSQYLGKARRASSTCSLLQSVSDQAFALETCRRSLFDTSSSHSIVRNTFLLRDTHRRLMWLAATSIYSSTVTSILYHRLWCRLFPTHGRLATTW
jgi:hypothetical protein